MLFHSHRALNDLLETKDQNDPEDQQFIFELEAALRYIKEDFDSTFTSLSNLLPAKQITYPVLWALFPPNIIVYGFDQLRNPRAWLVRSVAEVEDQKGNLWLQIQPKHIDYDGVNIGTIESDSLNIPFFPGAKTISDLQYFPLNYHPDVESVRKNLIEMGRKAMRLHGRKLVEYKGHALKEVPPPRGIAKFNVSDTLA